MAVSPVLLWSRVQRALYQIDPQLLILLLAPLMVAVRLGVPLALVLWFVCVATGVLLVANAMFHLLRSLFCAHYAGDLPLGLLLMILGSVTFYLPVFARV